MDPVVAALADQQAELTALLVDLDAAGWHTPTRCEGWDVRDVVLHLAQTNEMATGSLTGTYDEVLARLATGITAAGSVDEGADLMVRRDRNLTTDAVLRWWRDGAARLVALFGEADLHRRVQWVAGTLSARTLATTRIAETWIHTGDVAIALGAPRVPTDRLREIARLAWRTLPYAFASAGRELAGPVAFRLVGPAGDAWDLEPDGPVATVISGPAVELCEVAARRADPAGTSLQATGPDAAAVLELVRTYA